MNVPLSIRLSRRVLAQFAKICFGRFSTYHFNSTRGIWRYESYALLWQWHLAVFCGYEQFEMKKFR